MANKDFRMSDSFTLSPSKIVSSRQKLRKFYSDGSQFVTNVRIAANAREIPRRQLEASNKAECQYQLEKQAKNAQKKFDEVASQWNQVKSVKSPQKLYEMILEQKTACDEAFSEKDAMILYLKEELRNKEEEYVHDLKKEEEDIFLISQRIDFLIHDFYEAAALELNAIEDVIQSEYKGIVKTNSTEWKEALNKLDEAEIEYERKREHQVLECQDSLHNMAIQKVEEYKKLKEKLENDMHALQMELRRLKAVHILNEEKLEYNYQVLKKQEEEDVDLKMEQKRNIARLRDAVNGLRKELDWTEKSGKDEYKKLIHERSRYVKQTDELKKKIRSLNKMHASKFKSVWITREQEAKALLRQLIESDRKITRDILKLAWKPPDTQFTEHSGPFYLNYDKPKSESNDSSLSVTSLDQPSYVSSEIEDEVDTYELPFPIEDILQMILQEMGFLMEDKLQLALQHLQADEKMLPTIDLIFRALKIESTSDLKDFVEGFVAYLKNSGKLYQSVDEIDITTVMMQFLKTKNRMNVTTHPKESEVLLNNLNENHLYWEKYLNAIPNSKIQLWNSLFAAFRKYHEALKNGDLLTKQIETLKIHNIELTEILY